MPLLERKPLLDALSSALASARHGVGGIALVAGEAGAGKTTLVRAFAHERATHARVLIGACDPVQPPRPFAPVQAVAAELGGSVRKALEAGNRGRVLDATLESLDRRGGAPTVLVLEDLHWADEPTLDLVRILGRRSSGMRLLVVATFRDDESGPAAALRAALADAPRAAIIELSVPPLSVAAVTRLAAGTSLDARRLHAVTGGNAFFVSEAIAAGGESVPASVRDAVDGKARRASQAALGVLQAAAVVGYPVARADLAAVAGQPVAAVDEAVGSGLLVETDGLPAFRHELGRLAILDDVRPRTRQAVHRRALERALAAGSADPARLAAHAIGANDADAIVALAPPAAVRAASLGAHRQAADLYAAALGAWDARHDAGPAAGLADLLEAHAEQATLADQHDAAVESLRRAVALHRADRDALREGAALRELSGALWFGGAADEAIEAARSAIELLEREAPASPALAGALSTYGQRLVVSNSDDVTGIAASRRALALAESLGLEHIVVHALTTIGSVEANPSRDPAGIEKMEEAFRRAAAAGIVDEATRALINLLETALDLWQLEAAERYLSRVEAWIDTRAPEDFAHQRLLRTRRIQLDVDRGRWDAAVQACEELLDLPGTATAVRVRALAALGKVLARRGEPRGVALLEQAVATVPPNEIQDLFPIRIALVEARVLAGDAERARQEAGEAFALTRREEAGSPWWWWGHGAFWAWRAGALERLPPDSPEPYLLHEAARFREAADAWAALGFTYHEAVALADSQDPGDLRRALRIARRLGARPLVERIGMTLRATGAPPPGRGPSAASRTNPAGLTRRELEVLRQLVAGARDAEIAASLSLSPRTVGHHVSAILRKVGVTNRRAAGAWGARLGL